MMVVLVPIKEKIQMLVVVSSGVDTWLMHSPVNNNTNVQSCNGVKGNNFFHQQIATLSMHFLLFSFLLQFLSSPFVHYALGKCPVLKQKWLNMQEQDVITHLFNLTLAVSGMRAQIMTPLVLGTITTLLRRLWLAILQLKCQNFLHFRSQSYLLLGSLAVTEYYPAWIVNND